MKLELHRIAQIKSEKFPIFFWPAVFEETGGYGQVSEI